ncbi:MAG: acyltransferase [Polyangiaceae bacterium]|nr:acyltransferase [Polyangiaceae bacterium]
MYFTNNPLTELRSLLSERLASAILRRHCDTVGDGATVLGRPVIMNAGRIEIASGFMLSCSPVPSHLATGSSGRLIVGRNVRISSGASLFANELIEIGDETTIGPMAIVLDIDFHEVKSRDSRGDARPIRIGRGVRIGSGVVILRGAVIGDGAHIGPSSVVARAVPPGVYAEGVPARPIGHAHGW